MTTLKLAIDIGGTFIDVVTFDFETRSLRAFKLPTTPADPAQGVVDSVGKLGHPASAVADFVHGTTLGLNAVLERRGARVGIITNAGFTDIFEIGRGALEFADMYRFDYEQKPPLVERRHRIGVPGRLDYEGNEVLPLDSAAVIEAARFLHEVEGCEAIAVSFLHSYANDTHERLAIDLIRTRWPDLAVSSGAALANEYREYERTSTAVLDAYIKPVLRNYLGRLGTGIAAQGFAGKSYVMNSSGGALTFGLAEAQPVATILSGPAGGVAGALHVARSTGRRNVLSIDVGGTSLDACLIVDGQPMDVFEARIDTFPILQPIFDLRTLGAGGGSVAWIDNKLLRVGPRSAGAVPGPACYGRGGTEATVTDAAFVLGYLDTANFMGGEMAIATDLAETALRTTICAPLGIEPDEAARSIFEVLISRTSSSIREMMLERGLDPRDFSLLAFGGCGPLLGPLLVSELDMAELVVPPLPSVFSAWGMLASDLSFNDSVSVMESVTEDAMGRIGEAADDLVARSLAALLAKVDETAAPEVALSARLRFVGQEHTLSIPYHRDDTADALFTRFATAHHDRFGHTFDSEAESLSIMANLTIVTEKPEVSSAIAAPLEGSSDTLHRMNDPASGTFVQCRKLRRDRLVSGVSYPGPLLVTDEGSSLVVRGDQVLTLDPYGMICLKRVEV
jgi:N-methylhydantoinase A